MKYSVLTLPRPSDTALTYENKLVPLFLHPVYALLGLRPALAQHTAAEHAAVSRWATGRKCIVEIGVAEGVSALAMRSVMAESGTIYLIDPFHLSRIPALNFPRRVAHRAVESSKRGKAVWIESYSSDAVRSWKVPIDLLLIDGDHSEKGVERDWNDWHNFVVPGGVVLFHDARLFEGGWTRPDYGPVKLADRLFRTQRTPEWTIVEEVDSLLVVQRDRSTRSTAKMFQENS